MTAKLISCDEAGFTGPGLLDEHQPMFVYATHDFSEDESHDFVSLTREVHKLRSVELKSHQLRQRSNWSEIATEFVNRIGSRGSVIVMDKRLALAGKTFEYIFEPIIAGWSTLFYGKDLHRFTMNALYQAFFESGATIPDLAKELQAFMRSFDPSSAPSLFNAQADTASSDILTDVLNFAKGYSELIASENAHLKRGVSDIGKWALDLSSTCLFSLLARHWGLRHFKLDVLCDDSKPLQAMAEFFDTFVGRHQAFEMLGRQGPVKVRCNLERPLRFGSSKSHNSLQIADLLAGATVDAMRNARDEKFVALNQKIRLILHEDSILPDPAVCDITNISAFLNRLALKELSARAVRGSNPYSGMDQFYDFMEKQLKVELSKR